MAKTPYQLRDIGGTASKNAIINGALRFWQRGTTLALDGSTTYLADRFGAFGNMTGFVGTQSRETDVPTIIQAGYPFSFSHKMLATTGATAQTGGNEASIVLQRIEGYQYAHLHGGKDICLQFWVKAAKAGTMGIHFSNSANDRKYVTSVTINAANTWEIKRVNLKSDTTGTWLFTNGVGFNVGFMLDAAGNRLTSTLNQWFVPPVTAFMAPTNQTHFLSTNGDYVLLTGVQLVEGNFNDNITWPSITAQDELTLCQRYYEKSYDVDVPVPTNTAVGHTRMVVIADSTSTSFSCSVPFKTPKRAAVAAVTIYRETDSVVGGALSSSPVDPTVTAAASNLSENGFDVNITGGVTLAVDDPVVLAFQWAASIEL